MVILNKTKEAQKKQSKTTRMNKSQTIQIETHGGAHGTSYSDSG